MLLNAFDRAALRISHQDIVEMVAEWGEQPTALQVFRVIDEIKLMRGDEVLVPYALIERFEHILDAAMKRENITYKELSNRALWRDQEF